MGQHPPALPVARIIRHTRLFRTPGSPAAKASNHGETPRTDGRSAGRKKLGSLLTLST